MNINPGTRARKDYEIDEFLRKEYQDFLDKLGPQDLLKRIRSNRWRALCDAMQEVIYEDDPRGEHDKEFRDLYTNEDIMYEYEG